MHYLLFYEVGEDYVSRRAEFREAHLEKAWEASARGELLLGGALAHPVDGAVLLFQGDSPEVAERFARADPYVTSGTVKRWYVREWTTVAGRDAAAPVRPKRAAVAKHTIVRMWKGRTTEHSADDYFRHVTRKVFSALHAIEGYRGASLLRRAVDGAIEFVVLTRWESMEAVRRFAGADPRKAVVEPQAQAILTSFDDVATHFDVVYSDGEPEA
jgi:uncharacterized protein